MRTTIMHTLKLDEFNSKIVALSLPFNIGALSMRLHAKNRFNDLNTIYM